MLCFDIMELIGVEVEKIRKIKKNYLNVLKEVENIKYEYIDNWGNIDVKISIYENKLFFKYNLHYLKHDYIEIKAYENHEEAIAKKCIDEQIPFSKIHLFYTRSKHIIYNKNEYLKLFDTEEKLNKSLLLMFENLDYNDDIIFNQMIDKEDLIREFNEKYEEIKEKKFYNFSTCFKNYDYEPRLNYITQTIQNNIHNKKFSSAYRRFLTFKEKLYFCNTEYKNNDFKYNFKEFEKHFKQQKLFLILLNNNFDDYKIILNKSFINIEIFENIEIFKTIKKY
jgi:hypothetical protein